MSSEHNVHAGKGRSLEAMLSRPHTAIKQKQNTLKTLETILNSE